MTKNECNFYHSPCQSCEKLLDLPDCKESLFQYVRTKDPVLQKVVCKVIYCMLDVQELK